MDEVKRICFGEGDRDLFERFGLKESEVNAEAWHRAMARAYYLYWEREIGSSLILDERLVTDLIGEYHCQKAKLEGYLQLVPRKPCA